MNDECGKEKVMFRCAVCRHEKSREDNVEKVFHVDGRYVLVRGIPSTVCARCGEPVFSRETAERTRLLVRSGAKPADSVRMDTLDFAS